jgi:hypothetical protein
VGLTQFFRSVIDVARTMNVPSDVVHYAITGRAPPPRRPTGPPQPPRTQERVSWHRNNGRVDEERLLESFDAAISATLPTMKSWAAFRSMADDFIQEQLTDWGVDRSRYADYHRECLRQYLEDIHYHEHYFRSLETGDDACDCQECLAA